MKIKQKITLSHCTCIPIYNLYEILESYPVLNPSFRETRIWKWPGGAFLNLEMWQKMNQKSMSSDKQTLKGEQETVSDEPNFV